MQQQTVLTSADLQSLAKQLSAELTEALALDGTAVCGQKEVNLIPGSKQHFDRGRSALQVEQLLHFTGWIAVGNTPVTRKVQRMLLAAVSAAAADPTKKRSYMLEVVLDCLQAILADDITALEDCLPSAKLKVVIMDVIYLSRVALLTVKLLKAGAPSQGPSPVPQAASLGTGTDASTSAQCQPSSAAEGIDLPDPNTHQHSIAALECPAAAGNPSGISTGTLLPPPVPAVPPAVGTGPDILQHALLRMPQGSRMPPVPKLGVAGLVLPAIPGPSTSAGMLEQTGMPAVPPAGPYRCSTAAGTSTTDISTLLAVRAQHSLKQPRAGAQAGASPVSTAMLSRAGGADKPSGLDFPAQLAVSNNADPLGQAAGQPAGANSSGCAAAAAAGASTAAPSTAVLGHSWEQKYAGLR
jgi:hypothetical protein